MTKLLQMLGGATDVENLELPTELVVRESCGCESASL
jgi:hypothetical protein